MKRSILFIVSLLALGTLSGADEAKPAKDLASYLKDLDVKLEHTAQRVNQPSSTGSSVVGLRGSKQEPLSKQLYWKGKKGPAPVTPDEVKMFRVAIEKAKAGQKAEASTDLKSFLEKYPQSALKADAEDTIKLLN